MSQIKPDFDKALQRHLDSIKNRNIEAFKKHITKEETMYTVLQNGHTFTTPAEITAIHEDWFKDPNWIWEGTVVHKIVGEDMAMALLKYDYRNKPEDQPVSSWLVYVFKLQEGEWRIVHDQNTALDYPAFAKSAGLSE